ncbi:GDPGTP exchange factor Sec2p [Penicillium macrosclerotiorum]|uniref:GDPGTP exchange factor Sec2p n=1 Tax=Penicillium macrosclerotiorum TaxID=303699 RepID=UPI0025493325|nr:GDPGTP exchange factor Sec2p [Penicillium macrosclerotiorum]KAJ5690597.1 GDPGTP exchange factor Sec2p [Penicillium macrosclerotiorum]
MSATTTTLTSTTLVGAPSAMTHVTTLSEKQCPTCGGYESHDAAESHRRIQELEGHIQELTERAAITAGKLADYEDELHRLRSAQPAYDTPRNSASRPPSSSHGERTLAPSTLPVSSPSASSQTSTQTHHSRLSTLTSLLPYRRGSANPATSQTVLAPTTPTAPIHPAQPQSSPASSDNTSELQDALTREQGLRKAAETQLSQASTELEELTVQLFSQANEMVAQERKARAKLEERVAVLERRDIEKRSRLERLEKSMARVERLKALVNS